MRRIAAEAPVEIGVSVGGNVVDSPIATAVGVAVGNGSNGANIAIGAVRSPVLVGAAPSPSLAFRHAQVEQQQQQQQNHHQQQQQTAQRHQPPPPVQQLQQLGQQHQEQQQHRQQQTEPSYPDMQIMQAIVTTYRQDTQKRNTMSMYNRTIKEFKGFCDYVYSEQNEQFRYVVNGDKFFRFMFYNVFRNQKSKKGIPTSERSKFDPQDYEEVTNKYIRIYRAVSSAATTATAAQFSQLVANARVQGSGTGQQTIPDPENPLGKESIEAYRKGMHHLFDEQRMNQANSLLWENVYHAGVKNLIGLVAGRRKRINKRIYAEKINPQVEGLKNYSQVASIELVFWLKGTGTNVHPRTVFTSLRNRFSFTMDFSSFLRNESLHLAELSDLLGFDVHGCNDIHAMYIHLMMIATGKTVSKEGNQFGRATRHLNVWLCAIGAQGLYLLYRFEVLGEFLEEKNTMPDFRKNETWFDIKLLIDYTQRDRTVELGQRTAHIPGCNEICVG